MGGSGGGRGTLPTPKKETTCEELKFTTTLSSPIETILFSLKAGVVLDIVLSPTGTACVVVFEDKAVGAIIHSLLQQLINCIKAGNTFYAIVKSLDGAKCVITILHQSAL